MNAARKSCDDLGTYMCFGFFAMIAFQSVRNLGMCLSLPYCWALHYRFSVPRGFSAAFLTLGFGLGTKCIYT